jgi:site-specific DNA-methyltransferase (adenine-specific)
MYGSGFPKSLDVSKAIDKAAGAERDPKLVPSAATAYSSNAGNNRPWMAEAQQSGGLRAVAGDQPVTDAAREWSGWGTALKPAHEPIVVARKPLVGTVAANVLEHGTGALNIDGCRVATTETLGRAKGGWGNAAVGADNYGNFDSRGITVEGGRWPANVVLDEDQAAELDQQAPTTGSWSPSGSKYRRVRGDVFNAYGTDDATHYGDIGGASRFFYVAKAPARERPKVDGTAHPTVKPLTLMRWLCRLVTPPNGVILEPFAGSGTTVEAALLEGFRVVAIEREADYLPLIQARLNRVAAQEPEDEQLTLDASA